VIFASPKLLFSLPSSSTRDLPKIKLNIQSALHSSTRPLITAESHPTDRRSLRSLSKNAIECLGLRHRCRSPGACALSHLCAGSIKPQASSFPAPGQPSAELIACVSPTARASFRKKGVKMSGKFLMHCSSCSRLFSSREVEMVDSPQYV
jgi:hypothetical protein